MWALIKPVVKKEFRQIRRDKRTLGMLLFIPAFLLIMYGYALNFDVKHLALAVLDQEKSPRSQDFIERFLVTEYFDLMRVVESDREIDRLMGEGTVQVALVIPYDFSRSLLAGRQTDIQVIINGEETFIAGAAAGYVSAIAQSYSPSIIVRPLDLHPRIWFNPELRSARFLVPGLMAFVLMITVVISTAFSVVRERERGSIEQLMVSPLNPAALVVGKTIPYVLVSLVSAHLVLAFGRLFFGVSIKGQYGYLLAGMILFLVGGLGVGLLISTVARTQQVAFMIAIITTMLPTFVLSGFVFPIRNMPLAIQAITFVIPARYFLAILRGVMLKGAGLDALWGQMSFLVAFAALALGLSSMRLGKILKKGGIS
ncbi:MAG: ABC transporter permease [Clostridiales bacterium]|nr:ABC transporter permease [Clostridiales bacterium]